MEKNMEYEMETGEYRAKPQPETMNLEHWTHNLQVLAPEKLGHPPPRHGARIYGGAYSLKKGMSS